MGAFRNYSKATSDIMHCRGESRDEIAARAKRRFLQRSARGTPGKSPARGTPGRGGTTTPSKISTVSKDMSNGNFRPPVTSHPIESLTSMNEEVETKVFFWMLERKTSCREAKRRLAVGEAREATYGPLQFYVPGDSEFVEMSCPPKAPNSFTKEGLTEREIVNTRDCNHEKETRSYVCKEWKFFGDETIKDKWTELKPAYSYFRY